MTLAIAHPEGDRVVVDFVMEKTAPLSPAVTVPLFAAAIRQYGCTHATGDRYGGEFCREPFRLAGVGYRLSEKSKSELYGAFLPMLNSGRVALPDVPRLLRQLEGLERRTARGGRETIDHAPGGHDDIANAVAGAAVLAGSRRWRAMEVDYELG